MDLRKYLPNKRAFTAILVGSIMAILLGSTLLIVTYVVLSALLTAVGSISVGGSYNNTLNTSLFANITVITQALTIVGISLIVAGVAGIIYMLMGVAGMSTGGARGR
jgi:hypothetical protein